MAESGIVLAEPLLWDVLFHHRSARRWIRILALCSLLAGVEVLALLLSRVSKRLALWGPAAGMVNRVQPFPAASIHAPLRRTFLKRFQLLPSAKATRMHNPLPLSEFVVTNAGVEMPRMILYAPDSCLEFAVKNGFKGIDTVGHDAGVGDALGAMFESGIARDSIFIQTRFDPSLAAELYPGDPVHKQVENTIRNSLDNLRLEYLDSLVLQSYADHNRTMEAWRAMEKFLDEGLVDQLGISHVDFSELRKIYIDATVKPAVVQQLCYEGGMVEWCRGVGIRCQLGPLPEREIPHSRTAMKDFYYDFDLGMTPRMMYFRFMMGQGYSPIISALSQDHVEEDSLSHRVFLPVEDARAIALDLQRDAELHRPYYVKDYDYYEHSE